MPNQEGLILRFIPFKKQKQRESYRKDNVVVENSLDGEARRQGAVAVGAALRGTPRRLGCDGTGSHRLRRSPAPRGGCFCAPATDRADEMGGREPVRQSGHVWGVVWRSASGPWCAPDPFPVVGEGLSVHRKDPIWKMNWLGPRIPSQL